MLVLRSILLPHCAAADDSLGWHHIQLYRIVTRYGHCHPRIDTASVGPWRAKSRHSTVAISHGTVNLRVNLASAAVSCLHATSPAVWLTVIAWSLSLSFAVAIVVLYGQF